MRCLYEEEDKEIVVNDDYLFLINKNLKLVYLIQFVLCLQTE